MSVVEIICGLVGAFLGCVAAYFVDHPFGWLIVPVGFLAGWLIARVIRRKQ